MSNIDFDQISFDLPKNQSNVIKVIGVGGGGSNAINHMFNKGIEGIDFVVCNTDAQALQNSPVPTKIQLGATLTEGLGAGANPLVGEEAAMESMDEIKAMLDKRSKMVFITVGMGGGTGTGAAPVIAKVAKALDILTVGIVTTPFAFEGKMRNEQAEKGIEKLREHVDSLVIINNNKLREVYGNLGFKAGFSKADEVLSTAATGIAQVITHHYTQNIDLKDAKTVLSSSGTAIMGSATASGNNRAQNAITKALDSPLLNDNKITGARRVLLLIVSGSLEVTIDEIGEINDHIQSEARTNVDIIMGVGEDESLGEAISVTVIATGFNADQQKEISNTDSKRIVHTLVEDKDEKKLTKPVVSVSEPALKSAEPVHIENKAVPETPKSEDVLLNDFKVTFEDIKTELPFELEDKMEVEFKLEENFVIHDTTVAHPDKTESEDNENQFTFTFDFPVENKQLVTSERKLSVNDLEIIDLEYVLPEIKTPQDTIRHTLELEEEFAPEIEALKETKSNIRADEDLQFEVKVKKEVISNPVKIIVENLEDEVSPLNLTIAELRDRTDARRDRMKMFNYKFSNSINKNIDELETQPAYKRMGVDIKNTTPSEEGNNKSRFTLGVDDNSEIQLRSNNSFLHDNVD